MSYEDYRTELLTALAEQRVEYRDERAIRGAFRLGATIGEAVGVFANPGSGLQPARFWNIYPYLQAGRKEES